MNCGLNKAQLEALKRIYNERGADIAKRLCEKYGFSFDQFISDIMGNVSSVAPSSYVEVKNVNHSDGYVSKDVDNTSNIISYYAESTSRYNKMIADFSRDIISETFLEITSESFEFKNPQNYNFNKRTTNLNANIEQYKIKLANELCSILKCNDRLEILDYDDYLTKESKLLDILNLYWTNKDSLNEGLKNLGLDLYVKLKYFDDLIKNVGFITIDNKYKNSSNSFVNKYNYNESSVEQYSGFSNDQYMDAVKATSPLAKIILNYLPEINYHGDYIPNSSIGVNGFNYVTQRLKDWVESYHSKEIRDIINSEKSKGTNMDLGNLIDLWLRSGEKIHPLMRNKLNTIRKIIFGKNNGNFILPSNIRHMFTHMYEKTVSTSYVQYVDKDGDISPSSLHENIINMSKYRLLDNIIGSTTYWSHNKLKFIELYNNYKNKKSNIYETINKILFIRLDSTFDEYNKILNSVSSESLLSGILEFMYKCISSTENINDDNFINNVRKLLNDRSNKSLQSILLNTSKVFSNLETNGAKSVIKNNEGNNMPLNQMVCLAYLHKDIVRHIDGQDTGNYNPYYENLCYSNVDNIESPLIRSEVSINGKVKNASSLSIDEVMNVAIVDDFLYNLLNENTNKEYVIGIQTNCFSDKSKYFISQFNLSKKWNGVNLRTLLLNVIKQNDKTSIDVLKELWRNSWNNELNAKFNNIIDDYKSVFNELEEKSNNEIIDFINNYFKKNGKRALISKFNESGIDCIEEVHYSSGGFNNTLLYLIDSTSDKNKFNKYFNDQLYNLYKDLSEGGLYSGWNHLAQRKIVRDLFDDSWKESIDDVLNVVENTDPETGKKYKSVAKVKTPIIKKGNEYNPLLIGYFLAHNILGESYNRLMYGDLWTHPNKAKDQSNPVESLASRWIAQTKRLVIAGATYHSYAQGLKYGVSDEINIAVIDDRKTSVHNSNGDEDKGLDSMDGSGMVSPYYSKQENYSLIDAYAGGNKKTIFHDINGKHGNARLLKWAEYELSNDKRRNSIRSKVSAENIFRKMHNKEFDIDAKHRIVENAKYTPNSVSYYDPSRDINIKISSARFSIHGDDLYIDLITNDPNNTFKHIKINNIYDLDQAFGGAWCVKYNNQTNEYDWSNDNINIVNNIICECDLKDYMIAYVVNKSAIKVGAQNINSSNTWSDDNDFMTFKMSTKFGGVQMDADHYLEDSESTEPTQMLSALSQNGYSQDVVSEAYESLAELAMDSISKYTEALQSGDIDKLYNIVKRSIISTFESGNKDVIGLAQEFIATAKKLGENSGYKMPFSSTSINGIFTSTLMSDFTKKGIRRKYSGMGGVLNPSYDMMTYYEFEGKKVKYSELIPKLYNIARSLNITGPIEDLFTKNEINTTNGIIFNPFRSEVIHEMNPVDFEGTYIIHYQPKILGENILENGAIETIYERDGLNNIIYIDENGNDTINKYSKNIEIKTMDDFLKYRNNPNLMMTRDSLAPINLRGLDTTYNVLTSDGLVKYSHLENPFSIAMYLLKQKKLNSFIPINKIQQIALDLIEELSSYKSINSKLKELRKRQQSYFANIKPGDEFFGLGIIEEIETRPAEIMMGRIYAKELGLTINDNISDVSGPEFFENKMSNYYRIDNIDKESYDFILFDGAGKKLYIKFGDVSGLNIRANDDYQNIEGVIYNDNKEICSSEGKAFYKLISSDGSLYDLCVIDDLERLNEIINTSHWNNVIRNYTAENFLYMYQHKLNNDWSEENLEKTNQKITRLYYLNNGKISYYDLLNADMIESPTDDLLKMLNDDDLIKLNKRLKYISKKKYEAFKKSLEFVGTRIPCQSMQSFSPMRIVAFADTDINECYIPSHVNWIEGSDYDKLSVVLKFF